MNDRVNGSLSVTKAFGDHLLKAPLQKQNVVSSIPDVTVVDLKGNILSGAKGASQDTMLTSTNFKFKRKLETQLENSTKKMLEDALGEGKVIVQIQIPVTGLNPTSAGIPREVGIGRAEIDGSAGHDRLDIAVRVPRRPSEPGSPGE